MDMQDVRPTVTRRMTMNRLVERIVFMKRIIAIGREIHNGKRDGSVTEGALWMNCGQGVDCMGIL